MQSSSGNLTSLSDDFKQYRNVDAFSLVSGQIYTGHHWMISESLWVEYYTYYWMG